MASYLSALSIMFKIISIITNANTNAIPDTVKELWVFPPVDLDTLV